MKKVLIFFAFLLTCFSYSFAGPGDCTNEKIFASFNRNFSGAHNIEWECQGNTMVASFSLNGEMMLARYSVSGDLLSVRRNILSDKLPVLPLLSLKKNYENYWISNLVEVSQFKQTAYYMTIENADYKLELKSVNNSKWQVYSKTEKR
jgi:hypothetical protein